MNLNNVLALRINPEGTLVAIIAFVPPAGEIAIEVYRPVLHPSSTRLVLSAILNALTEKTEVFDVTDYEKGSLVDEANSRTILVSDTPVSDIKKGKK